jgi:CRISPR-associated exonuclease Cas4
VELIPLSAVNHYLYCPRRAALIHVEGIFEENEHTIRGDIAHEHADLPGYEVAKGVTLLRALPVWSERLRLSGKCDIVEGHPVAAAVTRLTSPVSQPSTLNSQTLTSAKSEPPHVGCYKALIPVEYKKGKRRQFDNDDAQLCAQALCLEEMFGIAVDSGAVFHAASKRRREVEFTAELRQLTENAIAELHRLIEQANVPPAVFKPACEECSLFGICLPKVTGGGNRAGRLASQLFQI